jgi:anti-anti-sigma factor
MEIRNYVVAGTLKMHLAGRLDGFWSQQVADQLESAIQQGHKHIRLNLSELGYLSSAGVQVLVRYYNELARTEGSLQVSNPSDMVRKVLSLSGLESLLAAPATAGGEIGTGVREVGGTSFEVASPAVDPVLKCQVVRDGPGSARRQLSCWKNSLVLGVGALAADGEREHFGPVFAAGGAALWLSADGRETPDYMVSAEAFTPELTLQQGIACEGSLTLRATFGAERTAGQLAASALEILGAGMGAMAILGNTPSGEPVMAVGVAIRTPSKLMGTLVKPLTSGPWPSGCFGAAIFSGAPVSAFDGEIAAAVAGLFKGRFEARVPQRILSGDSAASILFAEGCIFAGSISSITGE